MNAGRIWWGQIGSSLRLITKITNSLRDSHSVVLQAPQGLPWKQDFYNEVDIRRSSFSGERRLMRLEWDRTVEPGQFVLDELCSARVRAEYWPGQSYAKYLGSKDNIVLNEYYVWITGIPNKASLAKWVSFVTEYAHASCELAQCAVFVLEYHGGEESISAMDSISYKVETHDCRVFCLEAASELHNSELRGYQAELALNIGHGIPEVCSSLLESGNALLTDPVETSQQLLQAGHFSEGSKFPKYTEQEIRSAVWKTSIVLLFPVLEQYRMDFIAAHEAELKRSLPISNSNGEEIREPQDLEIGAIYHIVSNAKSKYSASEVELVSLCRNARNLLAHNRIVPFRDVKLLAANHSVENSKAGWAVYS